ncbi:histone H3.1 [Manis pentadactyla]|nr:histone H3.1 [Manis pentadactyla]
MALPEACEAYFVGLSRTPFIRASKEFLSQLEQDLVFPRFRKFVTQYQIIEECKKHIIGRNIPSIFSLKN